MHGFWLAILMLTDQAQNRWKDEQQTMDEMQFE